MVLFWVKVFNSIGWFKGKFYFGIVYVRDSMVSNKDNKFNCRFCWVIIFRGVLIICIIMIVVCFLV